MVVCCTDHPFDFANTHVRELVNFDSLESVVGIHKHIRYTSTWKGKVLIHTK